MPSTGRYDWGSNGLLLNNLAVLAAAHEITGDAAYRDAVLSGVDYLFGRNALGVSYVTGYGTRDVRNQHSRWYAHQLDATLPHPPRGTVSGGPNSDCPDPVSAALVGSPPQCCFVDDIGAYGVNEMTINWNSALAWVAANLAGVGKN
ncbi:glycoside hydrolase family 9 protein [Cellulomonas sp. Leaf395]|uniref:glycoside hydrolase family 9 protein n=1 Tax=Cellulomonas sp. Leaf395 TaxID=1736362 RepID=UPI0022861884|nr:glycoside hydrolase family 9 protein [Cellulomonas sp. Leaf395]